MIYFYDCETRSSRNVKDYGVDNHADPKVTEVTLVVFRGWETETFVWRPMFEPVPVQLLEPGLEFIAHNSRFDRLVYERVLRARHPALPYTSVEQWYDSAVISRANGLPDGLDAVLYALRLPQKRKSKDVSRTFSADYPLPEDDSAWSALISYGRWDVEGLAKAMDHEAVVMPSSATWQEFHNAERVNDRGLPIDELLLDRLQQHLLPVTERFKREFRSMTGLNPTQTAKINHWVLSSLPIELKFLALRSDGRPSLDKRTNLPALLEHPKTPEQIRQALQVLAEARKSSLSKLAKLRALSRNGRISGAYVFNGASATGRFSSKGAQVHNFPKASLEPELIDLLLQEDTQRVVGSDPDQEGLIYWRDLPKLASKALRSLITPKQGVMVWVDWSAIEACVLPWLTADPRTEARLNVLRQAGDIYMMTVKDVWGVEDRKFRQAGKAMELALGFCGGINAMTAFCENLGVTLDDEEKVFGLSKWREANQWALDFGDRLMEAFISAYYGEATTVGRITMVPWPKFKGVAMILPNRRRIVYPQVTLTADGAEFSKFLSNGRVARVPVWRGLLSENATQGTAASLLRSKIAQVESSHPQPVGSILVGTTHDEMILECSDPRLAERTALAISRVMVTPPPWLEGCPLNVEWQYGRRYSMREAEGRVRGIDLETTT